MTIRDDQGDAGYSTPPSTGAGHPGRRRAKVVVGVVGLAAVLGGGAYAITDKLTDHRAAPAEVGTLSAQQGQAGNPNALAPSGSPGTPSPAASASADSPEVVASINAARDDAAKDGVKLTRPPPMRATAPVVGIARTTSGSLKAGGVVRLVSARSDLTGQQELAWVAGSGITTYGADHCTQTFRFTADPTTVTRPNMLLCWRTNPNKSVVAIIVDPKGHPSRSAALKKLDAKWRSMG